MIYDYIVVGAGSSGAPLAARLSEDPRARVLLLEAGPDWRSAEAPPELRSPNPARILAEPFQASFQWPRLTARRTTAQQPWRYWRGRGLGGTSLINGFVALQALPEDFDLWADAGCSGWSHVDLRPSLLAVEDDLDFGDRPHHGQGGAIPLRRAPVAAWGKVDRALRSAAIDLKYGECDDGDVVGASGVTPYASTSRSGERVTTNDAYLEPARGRMNLEIRGDTLVDRINIVGGRATGVLLRHAAGVDWVEGREIILAAGVVHSPAILMRSGVGPADRLRQLDIDVHRDLTGVGQNLLDHPLISLVLRLRPEARAESVDQRYTNCCVRYSSGLIADRNDMAFLNLNLFGADEPSLGIGMLGVSVFRAFSRGNLHIVETDPSVDPHIDMRLLSDRRDMLRMRDGVQRLFDIGRHPAIAAIAERIEVGFSGRTVQDRWSADDLDAWIMSETIDGQHTVGTCRMGSPNDPATVVDPDCRVVGIEGLRVIDASIMPEIPRANTHLTCVVMAEHMARRLRRAAV